MNSTRSRWSLYGPRQMAAKINLKSAEERIEQAKREKIRAECELWNVNMEGFGGPAQPSPTINQALGSGFMFLQVKCHRCSSLASVNLQEVRRHGDTEIWRLEPSLRCQKCKIATHYRPHVHMIKLTETAEFDQWYSPSEDDRR